MTEVTVRIDDHDVEMLHTMSALWSDIDSREERFKVLLSPGRERGDPPLLTWRFAYWLNEGWAGVALIRAFLESEGFGYEVLFDGATVTGCGECPACEIAEDLASYPGGLVIVTDYACPCRQKALMEEIEEGTCGD